MFKSLPRQVFGRLQVSKHSWMPQHLQWMKITFVCENGSTSGDLCGFGDTPTS